MSKEEKICANHWLETEANMPKQEEFCANLWPETGTNMTNQEKFCACCFPKALDRPPGSALDSQALYTNMLFQGGLKHRDINTITGMLFQDGSLAQARGDLPMVKFGPLAGQTVPQPARMRASAAVARPIEEAEAGSRFFKIGS